MTHHDTDRALRAERLALAAAALRGLLTGAAEAVLRWILDNTL